MKPSSEFEKLVDLIAILRKECPWDRKQTHDSIKNNLIEEAYEAVDAIDNKNYDELSKELGDLLLHIIFHSKMGEEENRFTIQDVIYQISEKLIRRHPHVFSDTVINNDAEVANNWEAIKLKEGKTSIMDGIPKHLPGLIKAQRMQEKASNVGFDWAKWELAWEKLNEEIDEWRESVKSQNIEEQKDEFGDLLFSLVNVGRLLNLNADDSMKNANQKFETRFRYIENRLREKGRSITESNLEEMDKYWNEAKAFYGKQ
jgi:XTP/dITP diphosphohydrolase